MRNRNSTRNAYQCHSFLAMLAVALLTYAVFGIDPVHSSKLENQAERAYEEKCKYLNDDEVWVIFCVLEMGANALASDQPVIDDTIAPDQAKLMFDLENSWSNSGTFRSLSQQNRNSIYNFLQGDAPRYAYYEWACDTQKYDSVRRDTSNLINSIVNSASAKLLLLRRDEELDRMGYGLQHGICDYDQFYITKKSFSIRRSAVLSLLRRQIE